MLYLKTFGSFGFFFFYLLGSLWSGLSKQYPSNAGVTIEQDTVSSGGSGNSSGKVAVGCAIHGRQPEVASAT